MLEILVQEGSFFLKMLPNSHFCSLIHLSLYPSHFFFPSLLIFFLIILYFKVLWCGWASCHYLKKKKIKSLTTPINLDGLFLINSVLDKY
jgi:hypothetical protein